jgi:hypothetical protein
MAYALVIGVVIGVVIGAIAERVPVVPLLQCLGAVLVSMLLSAIVAALVVSVQPRELDEVTAVSVGIDFRILLMYAAGAAAVTTALHTLLGRLGGVPALAQHRPMILGCIGGLSGAVPVVRLIAEALRIGGMG